MKKILGVISFICLSFLVQAQTSTKNNGSLKTRIVEASCGKCNFGMKAGECALAVRIDGKAYWVDGFSINEYGDAHAHDGMCKMIRKAEVSGKIKGGKYIATSFKLLPVEKKKE